MFVKADRTIFNLDNVKRIVLRLKGKGGNPVIDFVTDEVNVLGVEVEYTDYSTAEMYLMRLYWAIDEGKTTFDMRR